jgi:hypothetical protein
MLTLFEEMNLYVYHSLRGVAFDLVIWCLHPLIHDSRKYGLFRVYLAAVTCKACRSWYRISD